MFTLYIDIKDFGEHSIEDGWTPFLVGWMNVNRQEYTWMMVSELKEFDEKQLKLLLMQDRLEAYKEDGVYHHRLEDIVESSGSKDYELYYYDSYPTLAALAAMVKTMDLIGQLREIDDWFPNGVEGLTRGVPSAI
ncbi:hypothetical protein [Vibrio phage PJN101]|nr:hypothetical protein [Vibrio phage PJN101]